MKRSKGFTSRPRLTAASFVAVAALAGASALSVSPAAAASGVPTSGSQGFVGTISSSSIDLVGFGIASFSDDPWTSLTITNKTTESQRIVALAPPYEMRYNGPPVGAQMQPGEAMTVSVSPDTVVTMSQDAGVSLELQGLRSGERTGLTIKVNVGDEPAPGYNKGTYVLALVNGQLVSQAYRNASTNVIPTMPGIDLVTSRT